MSVPVLRQGEYLIASIQDAVSDSEMLALRQELSRLVGTQRARGVIIDVTVLDVLDSFAAGTFRSLASMLRLRGAETVVVGIQPDVAFTMVQLGLTLEGAHTALDLQEGLAILDALMRRGSR